MYVDISSSDFKCVFEEDIFHLPKRWNGGDFQFTVEKLLENYREKLRNVVGNTKYDEHYGGIDNICNGIIRSLEEYFKGYPSEAFVEFSKVMEILMEHPLKTYHKTTWGEFFEFNGDPLKLYRVRNVQQNIQYSRSDIFHTPYNLRSKVATCRYSIAGYPSLYLGTSLELCGEESKVTSLNDFQIASRFELVRNQHCHNTSIEVIELAVKPQDFVKKRINEISVDNKSGRYFDELNINNDEARSAYISWYPLIAACSFIRVSKSDPFAAEYIIPQLLMQWIRHKYNQPDELFGIRYFSCASEKASEMGFNYVFPVSGNKYIGDKRYCAVLTQAFKLTVPKYVHEFQTWKDCEEALVSDMELKLL